MKNRQILNHMFNHVKLLDTWKYLPDTYGCTGRNAPKFFFMEDFIGFASFTCLFVSTFLPPLMVAELFSLIESEVSLFNLWFIPLSFIAIGYFGFVLARRLTKRRINNEQYQWMISVYEKIDMPQPNKKMISL